MTKAPAMMTNSAVPARATCQSAAAELANAPKPADPVAIKAKMA
jgi:hypothetical protein